MCDEIAIVGVGCRFPGAENLSEFWKVLVNGENHVREVGNDRWDFQSVYDPDEHVEGKSYVNKAGLLDNIFDWDNQLFGVSDSEAKVVDPQQRLVLDCCHMAMEDAGITRKHVDGSDTSVYIGAMNDDYKENNLDKTGANSAYVVTGTFRSILSARVSYTYNLKGPCMVVDTACSSSLVAMHLACQSLLLRESKMSIAGGVSVLLDPSVFVVLSKAHMLSPTGQCHAFTTDADGYARGEGCGIVILERLEDALAAGHNIWGLIHTGTNQDGRMVSPITAPSSIQQLELLKRVYLGRDDDRNALQVIESHGTGTRIGDPTEIKALGTFLNDTDTARNIKIKIGSVKTNIGHLESAAGVAGLIKVLLMMKNETIVSSLMYSEEKRNPKIDFKGFNMLVPTQNMQWSLSEGQQRLACVNSFGFGGSNAHLSVKQWLPTKTKKVINETNAQSVVPKLVVLSSLQQNGIVENLKSLAKDVEKTTSSLVEISMTSLCRRDHYKYRVALTVSSKEDLMQTCTNALQKVQNMVHQDSPRFVYVFCGVGTTWKGMCIELLQNKVFFSTVKLADDELKKHTGWSIIQRWKNMDDVIEPVLGHLSIFVCQLGIAAMWMKFGVLPDIVVGQSVGEVAACFLAGSIDIQTAIRIIFHRSIELSFCPSGRMMVVHNEAIKDIEISCQRIGSINIAVYISPNTCTVSGKTEGILELERNLKRKPGVKVKVLDVSSGYHSELVEKAGKRLEHVLVGLSPKPNTTRRFPIISTVSGKTADHDVFCSGSYWKSNVNEPVLFNDAILKAKGNDENTVFIEIGPSPVLKAHMFDIFGNDTNCYSIASVEKGRECSTMIQALGTVYEKGGNVDFTSLFENISEIQPSSIPRYVFNKRSFPVRKETKCTTANEIRKFGKTSHNYIVSKDDSDLENFLQIKVSLETTPYVYEHLVRNSVIIPGALYADVGFEIGKRLLNVPPDKLTVQYDLLSTVNLSDENELILEIKIKEVKNDSDIEYHFGVKWKQSVVCKGVVKKSYTSRTNTHIDRDSLLQDLPFKVTSKEMYEVLGESGFRYGSRQLSVLTDGVTGVDMSLIGVCIPEETIHELSYCDIHPSLLDGMIQSTVVLMKQNRCKNSGNHDNYQLLPVGMDSVTVSSCLADISDRTKMQILTERINHTQLETMDKAHYNVYLIDAYGVVLAQIENLVLYAGRGHMKCCDDLRFALVWKKIHDDFPVKGRTQLKDLEQITIINANNEMKDALVSIQIKDMVIDFFDTDCQTTVSSPDLLQRLTNSKHVIVFIDPTPFTDHQNAKQTMDAVSNNLKLIQQIMITIKAVPDDTTELTLVTLGVHASHYPEGFKRLTSLIGSEIWGFFRNFEVEFIYTKTNLVDIAFCNEPTIQTLLCLMATLQKSNNKTGREYCIYNKTVLMIEIHASTKRHIVSALRNTIALSDNLPTRLTSLSEKKIAVDKKCDLSTVGGPNDSSFTEKDVYEVCLNKKSKLYSTTISDMSETQHAIPLETFELPRKPDTKKSKRISSVSVSKKMLFDKMASYIVVGGLTGVGWMIVELMAEMGAGVIVTFGRRPCPVEMSHEIALLQAKHSCKIMHNQVDVADGINVKKAIQTLNKEFHNHPLRGIFQGAGIVKSVPLEHMKDVHIQDVLLPKIQGTLNLHNETKHLQLDFFFLLSSISAVIGTQAQSNYGAANSFLDAFANYRRQLGLQAQSINWGGISSGMAAVAKVAEELKHRGHILLKKEEFRSCFVHSLLTNETNVIYANLNMDILRRDYANKEMIPAGKKLNFLWEDAFLEDGDVHADGARVFNRVFFQATGEQEQIGIVQRLVMEFLSNVSNRSFDEIKCTDSFLDIGIDSMSSMTISNLIRNYFGVEIKTELMFDPDSTVQTVSCLVVSELTNSDL